MFHTQHWIACTRISSFVSTSKIPSPPLSLVDDALNVLLHRLRWEKFISKVQTEWRELVRIVRHTHHEIRTITTNSSPLGYCTFDRKRRVSSHP